MSEDSGNREAWEERYRAPGYRAGKEPSILLVEVLPELVKAHPGGRVLDLAMGEGRNAVFLAGHGFRVTGIERSPTAIAKARALAAERGVALEVIEADLEQFILPAESFEVVLCFYYLDRMLFPAMARALVPGGWLIYETYTREQLRFASGPRNPAYLLEPGELRQAFPGLAIRLYRETAEEKAIASLVAEKPCPRQ